MNEDRIPKYPNLLKVAEFVRSSEEWGRQYLYNPDTKKYCVLGYIGLLNGMSTEDLVKKNDYSNAFESSPEAYSAITKFEETKVLAKKFSGGIRKTVIDPGVIFCENDKATTSRMRKEFAKTIEEAAYEDCS